MKIIFSSVMAFSLCISNAQNKKEQIENLTRSLDSLNQVVSNERQIFKKETQSKDAEISSRKKQIDQSNLRNDSLSNQLNEIKEEKLILSQEFSSLRMRTDIKLRNLRFAVDSANTLNALQHDSIEDLQKSADSANTLSHITRFVQAFYNSLELSEAENLRQYEVGDVRFDLDNFYCLIGENAKYSQKRVENMSDQNYHDKYYVELLSIEDINFVNNKIIVSTKVLYAGQEMGSFYNEEQLTLQDNMGLLKLTSWLDVDLYKMEPSEYEHMANFTKDDFYQWLGSFNKN